MKLFLDSANMDDIRTFAPVIDGATTNPSLMAKNGQPLVATVQAIAEALPNKSVSVEVIAQDSEGMVTEGKKIAAIAPNIAVKLPLTQAGIAACRALTSIGIATNVTLCFSLTQALLAAKAGATYISPFVGRLDDIGEDGMALVADIVAAYRHYGYRTQVLAASIRTVEHVAAAIRVGAHCATIPPKVLATLYEHPLTDKGLAAFLADWQAANLSLPQ